MKSCTEEAASQTIAKAGSQPSAKLTGTFTGNVRIDPLFAPKNTMQDAAAYVTFEPAARTYWHVHPAGQHLVIVSGVGRTGLWGGEVAELGAGDVVWCPPGVKHWHGASPMTAMTHMAITGHQSGKSTEWMEEVTDKQYRE
jgi:quercetin dioxygenase-like cupin family protein